MPNLVVTKFVPATDPLVVGAQSEGRVTVKNDGTLDAGPFDISISFSANAGGGAFKPTPVDGLAAGESVQVDVSLSVDDIGDYTFNAQADADEAIAESNEDDNTLSLQVDAVSDRNLAFEADGLTVTNTDAGGGEFTFTVVMGNTGTGDVEGPFLVALNWVANGGSSTGSFDALIVYGPLAAGVDDYTASETIENVGPATYVVTAILDADNDIVEADETDNTATASFTSD